MKGWIAQQGELKERPFRNVFIQGIYGKVIVICPLDHFPQHIGVTILVHGVGHEGYSLGKLIGNHPPKIEVVHQAPKVLSGSPYVGDAATLEYHSLSKGSVPLLKIGGIEIVGEKPGVKSPIHASHRNHNGFIGNLSHVLYLQGIISLQSPGSSTSMANVVNETLVVEVKALAIEGMVSLKILDNIEPIQVLISHVGFHHLTHKTDTIERLSPQ